MQLTPEQEEVMQMIVVEKAWELYPDAMELSLDTEDAELFEEVMLKCYKIVTDDVLCGMILKGYLEVSGIDSDGDMTYDLTDKADEVE